MSYMSLGSKKEDLKKLILQMGSGHVAYIAVATEMPNGDIERWSFDLTAEGTLLETEVLCKLSLLEQLREDAEKFRKWVSENKSSVRPD